MTAIDTSKIDRMELRQEILALDEKRKELQARYDEEDNTVEVAIRAEIKHEEEIYEREAYERRQAFYRRCAEIRCAHGASDKSAEAALTEHDAHEAYSACDGFDDEGQAFRCCVSGLPILDGDETVKDRDGRKALVAALPSWPPFEEEDDVSTADGDDEAADEASEDAA